mgnify:CR=1 FL=1
MAADACLAIGRYQQAENLYSDLIKTFPSSEHQFHAHWLAIQAKLRLYRGPEYGDTALLEAEKYLLNKFQGTPTGETTRADDGKMSQNKSDDLSDFNNNRACVRSFIDYDRDGLDNTNTRL